MRVLLVEDDGPYAALLGSELRGSAIDLHRVDTLDAAVSAVLQRTFDAILLDLGLPDSSGLATVERMHDHAGLVPILVLTSSSDDGLAALSLQRGAQDYLLKSDADAVVLERSLRHARERAAFRQSMRDGEVRFRALVENSYDAVTLLDENGRVIYDSRSIIRVMGYTPEERLGWPLHATIHPDDASLIAEQFEYCLRHPDEVLQVEYRFKHKDGSWRWGEAIGVNRLHDTAVQAIVVNHRDVTDRKMVEAALRESEEQLRQAQKMEAVGRLAGGVAHDFNNVLTAIIGYCDLMLLRHIPGDSDYDDIQQIKANSNRAASLTRQLLAFSRQQTLQPEVIQLPDVISEVGQLLKRLLGAKITLRTPARLSEIGSSGWWRRRTAMSPEEAGPWP